MARAERLEAAVSEKQKNFVKVKKEAFQSEEKRIIATQLKRKREDSLSKKAIELHTAQTWAEQLSERNQRLAAEKAQLEEEIVQLRLECVSCLDAPPAVFYLPCGHLCLCADCDQQLPDRLCPKCRQRIQKRHRVFLEQQ